MTPPLRIISSMATQALLAELAALFTARHGPAIHIESVGGVDAAQRVQAGEAFDGVVLASDAIDRLIAGGHIVAASRVDLVRSGVAVAVRLGAVRPDIGSEAALRAAVLAAPTISCSTGPSGVQLAKLFERWGIADQIKNRMVQAKPGVPVGWLVAEGQAALGFQQLSEMMSLPGIDVLGPLPDAVQIVTTFSAGLGIAASQAEATQAWFDFMASPAAADVKRRQGMAPAL